MTQSLQEVCRLNTSPVQVNRHSDVIHGVKILGLESRNGRSYRPAALSRAVTLYEGAKVNVNHPKSGSRMPRDYQDRIGVIRNVTFRDDGLFADLQYNPKHQLAEQLAWDAEHAPENVGLSHNVEARVSRKDDQLIVDEIVRVRSIDLVADPATTRGLFESSPEHEQGHVNTFGDGTKKASFDRPNETHPEVVQAVLESLTSHELREARPDLVRAIAAEHDTELTELREAIESYRTLDERKSRVRAVLREYDLPDPDVATGEASVLLGEEFLERLLNSDDEATTRRLVRERAQLIRRIRWSAVEEPAGLDRPVSRDQRRTRGDWEDGESTKRFVREIS